MTDTTTAETGGKARPVPRIAVALPPAQYELLFTDQAHDALRELGEVSFHGDDEAPTVGELAAADPAAEILLTGWGSPRIDEAALEQLPALRFVGHCAGSVRPVVAPEALARGVRVVQAAAAMAPAVAELSLTMTLAMLRHLPHYQRTLGHERSWADAQRIGLGRELASAAVGVVSASRTGKAYLEMVASLGAQTKVYDPYLGTDEARRLGTELVELDELLETSDVVAVHAPSTDETRHLLGAKEFARIGDGGLLVNTARSWVWDEDALYEELASGRLAAAIDVFDEEPLPADHRLHDLDNVLLTPHVAGGTVQARQRQGQIVVDDLGRYLTGQPLQHEVTIDRYDQLA
jgi:phosphoglycerate dehydrogenase-like enzyme